MSDKHEEADSKAKPAEAAAPAAGGGGIKAMLPLIVSIVLMPVLAYAMTSFVLLPKLKASAGAGAGTEAKADEHGEEAKADAHGAPAHGAPAHEEGAKPEKESGGHGAADSGGHGAPAKGSAKFQLNKIVVNVQGTMGTRYLMTSFTLVGTASNFKDVMEENKDKLLDLASGSLAAKTIADLEKPGARNHIRSELLTLFNNSLPSPMVKELYITDMAVQ